MLSYDGTNYHGFQKQPNVITIQSVLENALLKITKQKILTLAASRTDKGVHAEGQVVSFQTNFRIAPDILKRSLNKIIPRDILILDVEELCVPFHVRYNVHSKIYQYVFSKKKTNPFNCRFQVYIENIEFKLISEAFYLLEGEKDFVLFTNEKNLKKNTIKFIYKVFCKETKDQFFIFFHGKGFLKKMILLLLGFLIYIGKRKKNLLDLKNMFNKKNKQKFRFSAPANGLCLKKILY
ncbi:MAG: tRNA pseudouridine(38-40) synthase TruA [Candidatus Phytoplasma stylosanthis]|uniref:tRNA pseudouridine(38-40) synthase TruA n=1 Tax=Candidatus Phytoplasma stylosanthis TaxID=2798314 RepID=UPI00293A4752|nr:tRNA pseudouridine(38-40) synthase TruA [Candidatus Phytoplasma stylosanthis]MDV3167869.1 tRNA pseudouridine(38-40) synthase TruA [Candidatus Phytoplasma stylosanthis]MDV3173519.1 tRNA pseudouridine(38-40) synthase TruA [Candidatus Phytoplasma stylosanthis]